ncbi:MAG: phosphoribosylanthranilate isomerase [Defluviitaleaceae bacterium]|nr:phosphoribosylanthranilate isomerase [Defluviitaleaceae bacterium]
MKIKICGLTRNADIQAVNAARPDYIGFVFVQQSKRYVTMEQAKQLRAALCDEIVPVGVFVNEPIENVLQAVRRGIISVVQLHGGEDEDYIRALKAETAVPIIKAVSVRQRGDAQRHESTAADYLLLDHKNGGTGEAFDWNNIGGLEKPFFLAGGLNTQNISEAIKQVQPFAVDLSSGAEVDGKKCPERIKELCGAVQA